MYIFEIILMKKHIFFKKKQKQKEYKIYFQIENFFLYPISILV